MFNLPEALTEQEQAELLGEPLEEVSNAPSWPEPLAPEAFYGLAGEITKTIEPHTEADPAAILITLLGFFGSLIGRYAYFVAEADKHFTNIFICLVGMTSKGRKGVSFGQVLRFFQLYYEEFIKTRITQGMSSGEGLIWAVRDEVKKEDGTILVDGVQDKRLFVVEAEFASTIRVLRREGNTLSAIIRKAWDDGNLSALTKNNPAKATGGHISILAHITKEELLRYLDNTETANGFGNRFLWVCVKRSKILPEGGKLHDIDLTPLMKRLAQAVEFGSAAGELNRNEQARSLWAMVYPDLSEGKPGLFGAMTARAEAQVMRLASIYALLDTSKIITPKHLSAALALWDYMEASAKFIFGHSLGDPVADEILKALKDAGSMTRTDISKYFGRNKGAREISRALSLLAERGLAKCSKEYGDGRPVETWEHIS